MPTSRQGLKKDPKRSASLSLYSFFFHVHKIKNNNDSCKVAWPIFFFLFFVWFSGDIYTFSTLRPSAHPVCPQSRRNSSQCPDYPHCCLLPPALRASGAFLGNVVEQIKPQTSTQKFPPACGRLQKFARFSCTSHVHSFLFVQQEWQNEFHTSANTKGKWHLKAHICKMTPVRGWTCWGEQHIRNISGQF